MSIFINILLDGIAVYVASSILPGVHLHSFVTALVVAIILGVVNTYVKPIITVLTLPLTILTLGLFLFIINGLIIVIVSKIVPGFTIDNFLWAILLSLVLSIVTSVLHSLEKN